MKKLNLRFWLLLIAGAFVAGCSTTNRSISNSAYREPPSCWGAPQLAEQSDPAFAYRGELSEFDVLGIPRTEITSDAEIRRTLDGAREVALKPGSSVLLIQSGAVIPDAPLVEELSKHFTVVPFSGVPTVRRPGAGAAPTESADPESYSKALRLTAARGGAPVVICCWGTLESASERLPTKTVSWVPLVKWMVPDEKQHMRIRLKLALLDVRTGNWSVLSPRAFEDARITLSPRRAATDQKQVEKLKELAYKAAVDELVRRSQG